MLAILWHPAAITAKETGIILTDDRGTVLFSRNADKPLVPASITKILTSLAAIETLGADYRFETLAAFNSDTLDLYVKGFGDPLFISEQIKAFVDMVIQKTGTKHINNIFLDHSFFHNDIRIPGTGNSNNPYDATTGALCANFNTVFFKWDNQLSQYTSAEPQTPLPPLILPDIKKAVKKKERILLSIKYQRIYPGLLIQAFLQDQGVKTTGQVLEAPFPLKDIRVIRFQSGFTLAEAVKKLLRFSNNFMASQIMLSLGANRIGAPATLEKGVTVLRNFARDRLKLSDFCIEEGSGLSRKNRFTPRQMQKMLMAFMPYRDLLRKEGNEIFKTGTLSDVRTRAGYLIGNDKRLYPFAIMVNHSSKGYSAIKQMLKKKVQKASQSPGHLQ